MAHKLYFDNKSTYNLTADDKAATFDGSSGLEQVEMPGNR